MLDLVCLQRLRLSADPVFQKLIARYVLTPNYRWPPGVSIEFEGYERVPSVPVVFAMNHTDRYNYWPFQYKLWWDRARFTATWVKGKYYEHPVMARFFELTNNIPTVSRGFIITKDFITVMRRRPTESEYEKLRAWVDASERGQSEAGLSEALPAPLLTRSRTMLGRFFDAERESYAQAVSRLFRAMMRRFVQINEEAAELGLDILIFPQGTRSVRLSRGHIGMAEIAVHLKRPVVPVGCSGSDRVYPGSSPVAKSGRIVYRFGAPFWPADMQDVSPGVPFEPFSVEAERAHRDVFQAYVDRVMDSINGLVDEPYRFRADEERSDGVEGTGRFV